MNQPLAEAALKERLKYEGIYSMPEKFVNYGHSNHGVNALSEIRRCEYKSLLDVGCGYNEFVQNARAAIPGIRAIGVDFACPGADVKASATELPFPDKSFEVVTSFDMLEHLLPEQVDLALSEFARVAHSFVFSIAYRPSNVKWNGETLHPTVETEEWWIRRIMRAGGTSIRKVDGWYLAGRWTNERFPIPQNCILVGNGPSVLSEGIGKAIDSFEEVVRFNDFRTAGFEIHTGKKITLWSTFPDGPLPHDKTLRPDRVVFTHGESNGPPYAPRQLYRIPIEFLENVRDNVQQRSARRPVQGVELIPTSGLVVASWLLDVVGVPGLALAGFDHFRKDRNLLHHYWDSHPCSKPQAHDGEAEAAIFAEWKESGKAEYLSRPKGRYFPARPATPISMKAKSILDGLIASLEGSAKFGSPFCHLCFDNAFAGDWYQRVLDHLPPDSFYHELRHHDAIQADGSCSRLQFEFQPHEMASLPDRERIFWTDVLQALKSSELETTMRKALDDGLSYRFGEGHDSVRMLAHPRLLRDKTGYKIGIHPDTPKKCITAQIYLPSDLSQVQLGTTFYSQLPSRQFLYSKRMRFAPNSGYAFAVHDHSWHGVDTLSAQAGVRNSLMLTYYLVE